MRKVLKFIRRIAGGFITAIKRILEVAWNVVKWVGEKLFNFVKGVINFFRKSEEKIDGIGSKFDKPIPLPGPKKFFDSPWWRGIKKSLGPFLTFKYWVKLLLWQHLLIVLLMIPMIFVGFTILEIQEIDSRIPEISYPSTFGVSEVFTPEVRRWTPWIMWWSIRHGVEPNAIATIMQYESCGNPFAVSSADAQGLFQVMPFHFDEDEKDKMTWVSVNARRGISYFSDLLEQTNGDYEKAFAGYHGGPGAFEQGNRVESTQHYVSLTYPTLIDALSGDEVSNTLESWIVRGPGSFCDTAAQQSMFAGLSQRFVSTEVLESSAHNDSQRTVRSSFFALDELFNLDLGSAEVRDFSIPTPRFANGVCDERGLPVSGYISQSSHAGHVAIDIVRVKGTPIPTTISGEVVHAGWNIEGYGNLVIVQNGNVQTYYAHLSEIKVEYGQKVRAGQIIGLMGNTGYVISEGGDGTHVHYEVRENWVAINPLSDRAQALTCGN